MNKTKKTWTVIAITASVIVFVAIFAWLGLEKLEKFDAKGYVRSVLNHNFRGDTKELLEVTVGKNNKDLQKQYDDMVKEFVQKRILPGVELDEETEAKYISLCKQIFMTMKYEVIEDKELKDGTYQVVVEYQVADVFQKYHAAKTDEIKKIEEKVQNIEYVGTPEEIEKQMKEELLEGFYQVLKQSYEEIKYSEKQTMTFVVKKNEKDLYTLGTQLNEFLLKITGEDAKQD